MFVNILKKKGNKRGSIKRDPYGAYRCLLQTTIGKNEGKRISFYTKFYTKWRMNCSLTFLDFLMFAISLDITCKVLKLYPDLLTLSISF